MKSLVEAVSNSLEVVEEKKTKKKRKVKEGAKTEKTKKKLTKKEKQLIEFADNTILPEHYKTVWTEDDLNELALWLKKQPIVAIDTETLGINPHADDIVGISLFAPTQGWYIPIQHKDDIGDADPASVVTPNEDAPVHVLTPKSLLRVGVDYVKCLPRTLIRETLKPLLEDKDRKLILHNAPFDYHILSNWMDIQITPYFDTSVAQGLLDENVSRKLKDLAPMYLKIPADKFNTLFGKITFNKVPILLNPDTRTGSLASYYAIKDAELTYLLYEFQMKHLNKESLADIKHLMFDIEMPFQQVVINAESRGIYMDEDYMVNTVAKQLHSELEEIRQKIWAYTGVINLNSPQQKAEALYVKLKLPVINKDKPRCTDKKTLKKLKKHHPVAGLLLEFSSKNKLATSFADKLPKMIKNGKIHASINQIGTVTGRLSCKNPNMQQVPSRVGNLIRNAFYAKEGRLLASLDFSQQEIRVLAHVSQDPVLLDIYRSGKDVHSMTGNGIWNAQHPDQEVDYETFEYRRNIYPLFQDKDGNWVEEYFEEEYLDKLLSEGKINHKDNVREEAELGVKYDKCRKMAKTVNFGIIYGMSEMGLSDQLEITEEEAKLYIQGYFAKYPGVRKWMKEQKDFILKNAYVQTMKKRKRRLYNYINTNQRWMKEKGLRMGINAIIQGSSADMTKIASLKLQPLLKELDSHIVMFIHDELLIDVPENIGMENLKRMADIMCHAVELDCGMKSDIEVGERWAQKMSEEEIEELRIMFDEKEEVE